VVTSWPYAGDSPVARARRIARAYRAQLEHLDPDGCIVLDRQFVGWGEKWMVSRPVTYALDDWLTPAEVADFCATSTSNLRRLRLAGRIKGVQDEAGQWRYQLREVLTVIAGPRTRRIQA
jgi:hypothetical protein